MSASAVYSLVVIVVVFAICAVLLNARITDCHQKGGEVDYFTVTAGLCLTPDGRVIG